MLSKVETATTSNGGNLVLSEHRASDYIIDKFLIDCFNQGKDVRSIKLTLDAKRKDFRKFISSGRFIQSIHDIDDKTDIFVGRDGDDEVEYIIKASWSDSLISLNIHSSVEIKNLLDSIKGKFTVPGAYVRWIYDSQYMESIKVPLESDHLPFTEMYPFLQGESLHDYYERFINSDASILLLIGPPGTGKTNFVKGLLHHTRQNAILTYHTNLLESDEFFADWFRSVDENIVILEDSDTLLLPRADGNTMMNRFLNLGDGLISIKSKKMIFTTNLPNVSHIDEALIRKGRCHDVVEFRNLEKDEAKVVADKVGLTLENQDTYSIADIFAQSKTRSPKKNNSFGFI
jgi:hypothetical protein